MRRYCHRVLLWLILLILYAAYSSADILVSSAMARHQIKEEFRDTPAKFGGIILPEGIKGRVVYADPPTACRKIQAPPNNTDYNVSHENEISRKNFDDNCDTGGYCNSTPRTCQEKILTDETSTDETSTNKMSTDHIIPYPEHIIFVPNRNIITACQEGQRKDKHGTCRDIV